MEYPQKVSKKAKALIPLALFAILAIVIIRPHFATDAEFTARLRELGKAVADLEPAPPSPSAQEPPAAELLPSL